MVLVNRLRHDVDGVAADLGQRGCAVQHKAFRPLHLQRDLHRPHVIKRETSVEEAHERPDGTGRVVVLGLGQQ